MARAGAHGVVGASLIAIATCSADPTLAHGGGLDRHGCHHDRKRGGYHCHRGNASPPPSALDTAPARDFAPSNFAPARRPADGRAFANCSEARAAGAAPVRRGDPGYGPHLDRDGDGVGCEPRRR
jgi:hypothetical protein